VSEENILEHTFMSNSIIKLNQTNDVINGTLYPNFDMIYMTICVLNFLGELDLLQGQVNVQLQITLSCSFTEIFTFKNEIASDTKSGVFRDID